MARVKERAQQFAVSEYANYVVQFVLQSPLFAAQSRQIIEAIVM